MRHIRFVVDRLLVDGDELVLRHGDVVAVNPADRDEAGSAPGTAAEPVDWECVVYAVGQDPLEPGVHELSFSTLEGRRLTGDAVLVRSVHGSHVLRGAGPLAGLAVDDLR